MKAPALIVVAVLAMLGHAHVPAVHVLQAASVIELTAGVVLGSVIVKALRRRPVLRFATMGGVHA